MNTIKLKKQIQLLAKLDTWDELVPHLINMGFTPQKVVPTGSGVFFTLYCDQKDEKELEEFVSHF